MHLRCMLALAAIVVASPARAQDEKIFRSLTPEQMEGMLKKMNIEYKKTPAKTEGNLLYDYKKNNFNLRLYFFKGKDLMVDAEFNAATLEKINEWNVKAKFSRATLHKDAKGPFSVLEWNLDLQGGVTEEAIQQFLSRFDAEVRLYSEFLGKAGDAPKLAEPKDEKVYKEISSELLEKVLKDMKLEYKKSEMPDMPGAFLYTFAGKDPQIRLHNWGKDLMMDGRFKKLGLEKINGWNTQRNFVRAVEYKERQQAYTVLESNLDCAGGVSESILRYFISVFNDEVKAFSKYASAE